MKTLVNKNNPAIRITAPEFEIDKTGRYFIPVKRYCTLDLLPENWTLVEEEQEKPILEVFGFKVGDAVRLKDGDGRKHIIKSFKEVEGIHGPNFYQVEFEDNSARDGIYPGKEYPNGYYTQMEKFEEEPTEWSKADCVKEIPFSLIYEGFAEHWRLGNAVEPGNYYIPISRLRWGIKGNLEENVDLEKAAEEYATYKFGDTETLDPLRKHDFKAGAEWQRKQPITFNCIGKKVKMTIQELIDYYINSECTDVADECGF